MYVRSVWQCKHEHEKGANSHNLVRNMSLCLLQLLANFSPGSDQTDNISKYPLQYSNGGMRTPI